MSGRVRGPARSRLGAGSDRWWRAADLALLAGLVVIGSLLLLPTYGSAGPVVAAAAGAVVPAAVFAILHRWSLPGWLALPVIPAAVLLAGALVVAPEERVLGVLPSPETVALVVRGSVGGWRDLLTVSTPTGTTGALLVPPLLIAAAGATAAGMLLRSRRPALALAGPAASAVAFALFGNAWVEPGIVVVVAGCLLVAGLGWVSWIGGRTARRAERAAAAQLAQDRVAGADGALGLRRLLVAGAVLTVAAVAASLVATGGDGQRWALREVVQAPVDPTAFTSPLALFRSYTTDHPDDVQLEVQGLPTGSRLRLATLDDYDGRQFRLSDAEGPFVRIGPAQPAAANTAPVQVDITVRDYSGPFLPLPGSIVTLDFDGDRADELAADLRYSAGAGTGVLPGGWHPGDEYRVVAGVAAQPSADQLAAARPSPVTMPPSAPLPDLLRAATERYVAGATTPAAQVEAIRAGLADEGFFSHGVRQPGEPRSPAGHGLDRLIGMVGDGWMVGDQEQYAALMAVLVRSLGIPARVAVGFAPDGSTEGTVALRGRDVTAWVEVPFEGFGWVAFDPTPSPDKPPTDLQDQAQTERRQVEVPVPPALPQVQPNTVDSDAADQQPQEPTPPAAAGSDTFMPALLLAMAGWTLLVLAVVAAPILVILAIKAHRRRRRLSAVRPADRITGGWQQLVDTAVDAGYRPAAWHTRSEVATDLAGAGVLQMDWLAPAADAAQFSPTPVNDERARSYWREVDDRSAELLGSMGFWRRWRTRLSLASLRRRDG